MSVSCRLWCQPQPEVSAQDWDASQRLCRPESAACILDIAAYYAFFTCTLFQGAVVQPG